MNFIRRVFLENWLLKLTAITLAFFLWLSVRGDRNVERILTVSLEIRIPRNMEITNDRPSFVEVTVRGTPTNLGFLPPGPPAYTIDLQSAGEGTHDVPLSAANVRISAASGLEVLRVSPPRITLVLEQTITKEVPVVLPPLRGEPASGFDIYKVTYWPTRIAISGPRSRVNPVGQINTAPVSVDGLSQSLRTFASLRIEDHSIRAEPAGPVEVNVQLGVHRESRTIAGIPVTTEDPSLKITPARISLQVLVPVTLKEKLGPDNFSATIPAASMEGSAEETKVKPQVRLVDPIDPAIVIERIRPAEVTVRRSGKGP